MGTGTYFHELKIDKKNISFGEHEFRLNFVNGVSLIIR